MACRPSFSHAISERKCLARNRVNGKLSDSSRTHADLRFIRCRSIPVLDDHSCWGTRSNRDELGLRSTPNRSNPMDLNKMRLFSCQSIARRSSIFENSRVASAAGTPLGYLARGARQNLQRVWSRPTRQSTGDERGSALGDRGAAPIKLCANAAARRVQLAGRCEHRARRMCAACRHNRVIPELSDFARPSPRLASSIEVAKHRLFYTLYRSRPHARRRSISSAVGTNRSPSSSWRTSPTRSGPEGHDRARQRRHHHRSEPRPTTPSAKSGVN